MKRDSEPCAHMNRRDAIKIDKDFYFEKDESGEIYVYGSNTGFAYRNVRTEAEGKEVVDHLYEVVKR